MGLDLDVSLLKVSPAGTEHLDMAFPRAHLYLSLSGPHYGLERWSVGLRLNNAGGAIPPSASEGQALCDQYAAAVQNWWTTQTQFGGAKSKLDLVKLNAIGPNGKYLHPWTNLKEITPAATNGLNSTHAPQVAAVATLLTGVTRGPSSKGRIYLPAPIAAVGDAGTITPAVQDSMATAVKALIDAVNAVSAGRSVIVASGVGSGAERTVTRVEVGAVLDTMRSRRRSLPEARIGKPVVGATFLAP